MSTSANFHARDEPVALVGPQPWRVGWLIAVFIGLLVAIGLRLHELQVEQGTRLSGLRDRQIHRKWDLQAARGSIVDAEGAPLAADIGSWAVYCDAGYMNDRLRATVALAPALGVSRDELRRHFESRGNGRCLAKGLDDATAERVRGIIELDKLAGLYVRREFTRTYPAGRLAAHVVGFLNNGSGVDGAGIESTCHQALAGTPGFETVAIDAHNRPFVLGGSENRQPRPGANVQLTIIGALQRETEAALAAAVERHQPKNAAAVLLRPATGEILALASWPDFDPGDRASITPASQRNNVIAFAYEPGSTMKPLIAGIAVAEGLARWEERIDCERGAWPYRGRVVHEKTGGHGVLGLIECIALSDNIAMAKLGVRIGERHGALRMREWMQRLGFGQRSGVALPDEDSGLMTRPERWTVRDTVISVSYGHEILVTPMQLALAHAAVANGGVWNPPRLVRRMWSTAGESAQELPLPAAVASRRVYTSADAARIQEAMNATMTEGTGKRSALDGWSSAGKTGTAEKVIDGRYSSEHNVGSFVCWAPASAERAPELLCLVVIDDPSRNGRFGSETAAPVVQRILQFSLAHLGVPREREFTKPEKPEPAKPGARTASTRRRQ